MIKQYQARTALVGSTAILAAALLLSPVKLDPHHGLAGQQAAAASLGLGGHAGGNLGGGLGGLGGNLGGGLNGAIGAATAGTNVDASTAGDASLGTGAQTAEGSVSNNLALQQQATDFAASSDTGANLSAPAGLAGGNLQINAKAAVK